MLALAIRMSEVSRVLLDSWVILQGFGGSIQGG